MNGELGLRKQPVRHRAVRAAGQGHVKAGDINFAVGRAADIELRALYVQHLEFKLRQRLRRHRQQHTRQQQGVMPLGVEQTHIGQLHRGNQAIGVRHQGTNAHRYPE